MDEKTLEGTCEKIIFHNAENGYTVFKIKDHESQIHTCTGSSPLIQEKSILHLSGNLVDGKYGPQLQCSIITPVLPKTKNQIVRYLSSGVIAGIGEGFARKLVDFAGIEIFDKLDQDPESFYQIKGVGEKRIAKLLSHWQAHRHCHEVMLSYNDLALVQDAPIKFTKHTKVKLCKYYVKTLIGSIMIFMALVLKLQTKLL